jgi:hypothetical protein
MKKYILGKYLVLLFIIGFVPGIASAANVYLETSRDTVSVGDTFIISAKVDAEETSINSVEGDIMLGTNNNLTVNDFSLAKSIFSLWPRTPSLSSDGNTISFTGGVPGGFKLDKAILFNIVVEANKEGTITISPKNIVVFANDGAATKVSTDVSSLTINILPKNEAISPTNEWISLVTADKQNPEQFSIAIGEDASLFEGKRFAFFTAVDNQSGISYYEVSENGGPAVRSGSMYVLQNQDENVTPVLEVTAYDKAGNKTTSVYKESGITIFGFSLKFILTLIAIVIAFVLFKKVRKIKRNRKNVLENK